jgi:hypothetical protein
MPPIILSPSGKTQAMVAGSNITFSTASGQTSTWSIASLFLCDQNYPNFPTSIPNPLPTDPGYLKKEAQVPVTNGLWSHTFTNVGSGKYALIAVKGDAKVVTESDHIKDISVP